MNKKSQFVRAANLMSALIVLFLLSACDSENPSQQMAESIVRPAKLMEVGRGNNTKMLSYPAIVQSRNLSSLAFQVGGRLDELLVVEATLVEQGDVLAKLDQRDLQTKLMSAKAQYENADSEYQRALRLIEQDAIARSVLEQRKTQVEVSKSLLESAEKALDDAVLVAPFAGAVSKVFVEKQQIVQAGETAMTILGKGNYEALINLPASIVATSQSRKDDRSDIYIVLDAAPERQIPADFAEVSLEADVVSQTYAATFTFEVPTDLVILPGMNAIVWINGPRSSEERLSIPLTAIAIDGDQKYVWVVDHKSMIVSRRNIIIEDGIGIELNVSSGLKSGELVVAAGVSSLSEGMKVRPWTK